MLADFVNEAIRDFDISAKYLHYNKDTNTLSAEISELPGFNMGAALKILSPRTGVIKEFHLYKTDMDATQEDTYGWRFRSDDGIELLIIND